MDLNLKPVCRLSVQVGPPVEIGQTETGRKRIIPIIGGRVEGERITGNVLNLGADWQTIHDDGTAELDTRYVIETGDGATIDIRNWGFRVCPPEVQARIAQGESVDVSEYTMITTPRFETASPDYLWLNNGIFVARCERYPEAVRVSVYEVVAT